MALCLTTVAVGLLVGLAYSQVQRRELDPGTFALLGLVGIVLGAGITSYFYPFEVGLLLGLFYGTQSGGLEKNARLSTKRNI